MVGVVAAGAMTQVEEVVVDVNLVAGAVGVYRVM
jgi:hypothetical protein